MTAFGKPLGEKTIKGSPDFLISSSNRKEDAILLL
jgi:hypothetical protein